MNGPAAGCASLRLRAPVAANAEDRGPQAKAPGRRALFRRTGITFAVYGDDAATERLIPFDIIPRILSAAEWRRLAAGIEQRVRALNAFMYDIYHRQEIIKAGASRKTDHTERGVRAGDDVRGAGARHLLAHHRHRPGAHFRERVLRARGQHAHAVRRLLHAGEPGGDDAHVPELFARNRVRAVEDYPDNLRLTLESVAPEGWTATRPS